MHLDTKSLASKTLLTIFLALVLMPPKAESGIYKMMAEAMMGSMMGGWGGDGGGGKGITFGLKSNGMTAIIPIPYLCPSSPRTKEEEVEVAVVEVDKRSSTYLCRESNSLIYFDT
ncbi:hypothetical protein HNY73_019996 [Argiope bruennichi]|uniref:Uncharacterized protein n=1 Tax=Argiope bruennichi TaxID=94029 RepID=A0A8T0E7Y3_ARGBR|nr:hypothetical protein HNY73_019996 [Argiope bruennichi]